MTDPTTPNTSGMDTLTARIANLPADSRDALNTLIDRFERDQQREQVKKEERLKLLEKGTRSLPITDRLALHIMGELALHLAFNILDIHGDGLEHFFRTISAALESGLQANPHDWREIKDVCEGTYEK